MKTILILTTFFSIQSFADSWVCTEAGLTRDGNVWAACGVGESVSEARAREASLESAIGEFKQVCKMSSDCHNKPRTVEPKRLSCIQEHNEWKCTRMIQITVF